MVTMLVTFLVIKFYFLYLIISLVEDTLRAVTFYFRLDLLPLTTILVRIGLELVLGQKLL